MIAVPDGMEWRYAGHVGTGFSNAVLEDLHGKLWPLRTATSPFKQRVKGEPVTTWVKPQLVAEVKFTEWTAGGEMRHPAFLGLRCRQESRRCRPRERNASSPMSRPLLVIAGDSFAHRAYHGLPKSIRRTGDKGASAILGFANFLRRQAHSAARCSIDSYDKADGSFSHSSARFL